MKKTYENAELELVLFGFDVLTTSTESGQSGNGTKSIENNNLYDEIEDYNNP